LYLQIIRKVIDNHSQLSHRQSMIHCLCNNINTAKVDAAAAQGAETAACVQRACGTRFNCGQCRADIDARLAVVRMNNPVLEAAE
jgi:bacterioferritin-associated ferredoxin